MWWNDEGVLLFWFDGRGWFGWVSLRCLLGWMVILEVYNFLLKKIILQRIRSWCHRHSDWRVMHQFLNELVPKLSVSRGGGLVTSGRIHFTPVILIFSDFLFYVSLCAPYTTIGGWLIGPEGSVGKLRLNGQGVPVKAAPFQASGRATSKDPQILLMWNQ